MSAEPVLLTRDGSLARVILNRPEALNALDPDLVERLGETLEALAVDADVRVVVLKGAGDHFMAGGDLKHLKGLLSETGEARKTIFRRFVNSFHRSVLAIRHMEKPVIAEVRGAAAGAGFSLALACDLVVAASGSRFVPAYGSIGASPDGGMTFQLPRLVGPKKAFEIAHLSDGLEAKEALALGLINKVLPPDDLEAEVAAMAERLASGAAEAVRQGKHLLSEALEHDLETQLGRERESFAECAATDDFEEGINAFLEKRQPLFGGK